MGFGGSGLGRTDSGFCKGVEGLGLRVQSRIWVRNLWVWAGEPGLS